MPVFNQLLLVNNQLHNGFLAARGPVLQVEIQVPTALATLFQSQSKPLPTPITGLALIDSGASKTCVDDAAITQLGVAPINQITVQTPSGSAQQCLYPARFTFPGTPLPSVDFGSVVGSTLASQGIVALMGRDFLSSCLFVYNGTLGMYSLAF